MNVEEQEKCLNEAMEQHGDYIKRLIYTYVQDIQKTEDIVQDVFIKFYNSLHRFDGRSTLKTYLYRIAVNESLNYLRSWHHRKIEVRELIETVKKRFSAEEEFFKQEQKETLQQLIQIMPTKYREVLWLYYYNDLSVAEIAIILKCAPNTVKTRLARGRKLAKLSIEESEIKYEY
ncbi:RNA polymerase sigma-70 factor (ECF subfamily) [Sporosarcina luteola]|nr:RNA polymerase sigma-70 factor (ECF subfamily) [Sporosarcina luteola]